MIRDFLVEYKTLSLDGKCLEGNENTHTHTNQPTPAKVTEKTHKVGYLEMSAHLAILPLCSQERRCSQINGLLRNSCQHSKTTICFIDT